MSILVDPLSVLMMLVVTGVSTLIHLYSVAYMGGDRGYTRFFAYLNFFVFSMLLLVLAAQLLPAHRRLGVRRRGVLPADLASGTGAPPRRRPGIKAFVINVVGDVGLVLGHVLHLQAHAARWTSWARSSRPSSSSPTTTATSPPAASCCWSARSPSPRRSRCTPGSRTRWRARRRSPR